MKTVEKRIFVSEMEFSEHTFLLGLLTKLKEDSVVAIDSEEDEKIINHILDGLKAK